MPSLRSIALSVSEIESSSAPFSAGGPEDCTAVASVTSSAPCPPLSGTSRRWSSACPSLSLENVTSSPVVSSVSDCQRRNFSLSSTNSRNRKSGIDKALDSRRFIGTIPVEGSAQTEIEANRAMKLDTIFFEGSTKPSGSTNTAAPHSSCSDFNRSHTQVNVAESSTQGSKKIVEAPQPPAVFVRRKDVAPVRIDTERQLVQILSRGDGVMKDMQRKLIRNLGLRERFELEKAQESILRMQSAENSLLQRMIKNRDQRATRPSTAGEGREKQRIPLQSQSSHCFCGKSYHQEQIRELQLQNKKLNLELSHVVQQLREVDSERDCLYTSRKISLESDLPVDDKTRIKITTALEKIKELRNDLSELRTQTTCTVDSAHQLQDVKKMLSETFRNLHVENLRLRETLSCESTKRQLLQKELLDLKGNIRVIVRCRPLLSMDYQNKGDSCTGLKAVEFDPSVNDTLTLFVPNPGKKGTGANREGDVVARHFEFDRVFRDDDSQDAIFADIRPVIASAIDGYNVCIFAYGQTGSGKTFTMEGDSTSQGITFQAINELFAQSADRRDKLKVQITASMLEVYNEGVYDLLTDRSRNESGPKLEIKNTPDGTVFVEGLTTQSVTSPEETRRILAEGQKNRAVGYTSCNDRSSRSHSLFCLNIECSSSEGEYSIESRSKLWLIDLAGSERLSKSIVDGARLTEAKSINKSLSALGDVINALATKASHVPYRNSKLTRLLQDSLGKSGKVLMIVQISPTLKDAPESHCSLLFAERARGIELGPAKKHIKSSPLPEAKSQISELRSQLLSKNKLIDKMKSEEAMRSAEADALQTKLIDMTRQLDTVSRENNNNIAIIKSLRAQRSELDNRLCQVESTNEKNPCVRSLDIHESTRHCEDERRLTMDFSTVGLNQISDEEKENQRPVSMSVNRCGKEQSTTSESLVERKLTAKKRGLLVSRFPSNQETNHPQHQREISTTAAKTRMTGNFQNSGARRVSSRKEQPRPRWS